MQIMWLPVVALWIMTGTFRRISAVPPAAEIKDYGFMAMIIEKVAKNRDTDEHFKCSGLLISKRVVFTACSCIGSFSFYRGVEMVFNPINYEVYKVLLGVEKISDYLSKPEAYPGLKIETVKAHEKCSWDRIVGYKFNWGAVLTEVEIVIKKPLSLAPPLLRNSSSELEAEVLEMIIEEKGCFILGYGAHGSLSLSRNSTLRRMDVNFITFMDCNRRVCQKVMITDQMTTICLRNIDVANSGDLCASTKNESDNCYSDRGSPLLCGNKLTGVITFRQKCVDEASPVLAARMEGAVNFYYTPFGRSSLLSIHSWRILALLSIVLLYS